MKYKIKSITSKHKTEFSKKWLVGCILASLFFTLLSYILAWFEKDTMESLSITIIQTLWGTSGISFGAYVVQNSIRAYSKNKFIDNSSKDISIVEETPVEEEATMSTEQIINDYEIRSLRGM